MKRIGSKVSNWQEPFGGFSLSLPLSAARMVNFVFWMNALQSNIPIEVFRL